LDFSPTLLSLLIDFLCRIKFNDAKGRQEERKGPQSAGTQYWLQTAWEMANGFCILFETNISMKRLCKLTALALVAATLQFCSEDNNEAATKSEVSFEANLNASLNVTESANPIESISYAHVILENPHGKVVVDQELQVTSGSNTVLTSPVQLSPGEYRIREFSARDVNKTVLYNLTINLPTRCEGDKNLLQTFYAGGSNKSISVKLYSVPAPQGNN
jgi:hypothetical protein